MTIEERYEERKAFLLQTIAINELKGNMRAVECAERELATLENERENRLKTAKEKARKEAMRCERR